MKKLSNQGNLLALTALILGTLGATQAGAGTIYTVNETITSPLNGIVGNPTQTDSVVGTITTDGTIGVLHSADISSWNLDLIDVTTPANTYELTTSNSSIVVDFGSVLNASATGLFFDFTNTGGFGFQANVPGPYSGYHYWCLSQNYYACDSGNTIAPGDVYPGDSLDDLVVADAGTQGQLGNSPLNQSGPSGVPEPATWALVLVGFGGIGFMMRKSRRKGAVATA
jgi:hypothetical protein